MLKYGALILVCFLCGCSVNASVRNSINIERKDGINAEEAALIAISYVEKDDYYQKYYSLSQPKVKDSVLRKNCWAVEINPNLKGTFKAFYPLQISVDKDTGEIKGVGPTK
jgi:hypothetical protein